MAAAISVVQQAVINSATAPAIAWHTGLSTSTTLQFDRQHLCGKICRHFYPQLTARRAGFTIPRWLAILASGCLPPKTTALFTDKPVFTVAPSGTSTATHIQSQIA